ncbi:hypothetical protein Zmor_009393 [Zophobas morio]|uniref:Uncharacterized protein n=1 Tax=Zophobas morio TaxID=2755281 RepID=A0AA38MIB2_9CUCU|nr:hypothetical protein Zmor_009393 [Zophobas morio]
MLQCLKTLNVMTFQTSKPLRVVPPRQPHTKPPGHPSPLLKSQKKFKFTFVSQKNCVNRFERILLQILRALGICSESDDILEVMDEVVEALGSKDGVDKETAAKILQISLLGAMEGFKSPEMVDVGTQCCMEKKGTEAWVLRDPRRASMFYMETENGKTGNSRVVLEQLQLKEMSY